MSRITNYTDAPENSSTGSLSGGEMVIDGPRGTKRVSVNALLNHIDESDIHIRKHTYRGKFLGYNITPEQHQSIVNGTFEDMFIGDYWIYPGGFYYYDGLYIASQYYFIADFDYYLGFGNPGIQNTDAENTHWDSWDANVHRHHIVLYPTTYTSGKLPAVSGNALVAYGHGNRDFNFMRPEKETTDPSFSVNQAQVGLSGWAPIFTHRLWMNQAANTGTYDAPVLAEYWSGLYTSPYRMDNSKKFLWQPPLGGEVMGEVDYYGHAVLQDTPCYGHNRSTNLCQNHRQFELFRLAPWLANHTTNWDGSNDVYLRDNMCVETLSSNTKDWRVCQSVGGGGVEVHGDAEDHRGKYYIVIG